MAEIDDHVLWQKARLGDPEAFGSLFERHARRIYAYCFRRTGDWALAEDLTSVTFLEAWRRRDVDLQPEKVEPWLFGIASNVLRTQRRALRRYGAALRRVPAPEPQHDFADDAIDRTDAERSMREILNAVSDLPTAEQEVIALTAWEGLSYAETAYALGVSVVTIRTRLFRAKRRLRERLGNGEIAEFDATADRTERTNAASEF
jgi:RNA polymerase sigma-70 factor (ECF subfamily)